MKVHRTKTGGVTPTLRERKAALTRLGLLDALVKRLRRQPFDAISVQTLCDDVNVSVPTFFNHFRSKNELLVLYVRLWSIEAGQTLEQGRPDTYGAIERLLDGVAEVMEDNPRLMRQIVSHVVREPVPRGEGLPTSAEIALRFPDLSDTKRGTPLPVGSLFRGALERAAAAGELPRAADIDQAVEVLTALFFGAAAIHSGKATTRSVYRAGLDLVWRGVGGRRPANPAAAQT